MGAITNFNNPTGYPIPVSATDPMPVTGMSSDPTVGAAFTDGSGAIVAGAVSEEVFAADAARVYLFILNLSDTDMWINFGVAAVAAQPSIKLVANGGYYEPLVAPTQAVNIICATTGKTYAAKAA